MSLSLILLAVVFGILIVKIWPRSFTKIPMPLTWHPLLGNAVDMFNNRNDIFEGLWVFAQQVNEESFGVSLPTQRMRVLVSPQNVEHMLKKNFNNYEKGADFRDAFEELLGEGIFAADGNQWRSHRKAASHMFSLRRLSNHAIAAFTKYARVMVDVLDDKGEEEEFDLQRMLYGYTFDAFSNIAFGQNMSCILGPHPFPSSFQSLNNISSTRLFIPGIWKLVRFFRLGVEAQTKKEEQILNNHVQSVITSRLSGTQSTTNEEEDLDQNEDEGYGSDLLGLFMEAYEKREGTKPSPKVLRDVVMNFMIAGMDTTAWTCTAMIMMMGDHPEAARKCVEEVDRLLPGDELSPLYPDLTNYTYLEAFMLESLRLYPSVPLQFKYAMNDDVMPADNTQVKRGDMVIYSSFVMGRLRKVWGADALEFKPERWLGEGGLLKVNDCKYPVFNVGKRNCLGKPMAIMEVKLLLATLLKRYKISVQPGQSKAFCLGATLQLRHGLNVTVKRR